LDTAPQGQMRRPELVLSPHPITLLVHSDNIRRLLKLVRFDLLFEVKALF